MTYYICCAVVFLLAYTINLTYISVFYHRGLAHGAVELSPWVTNWIVRTGSWVTGLDPKGWVCMHRMHHTYSDTPEDPHSPVHQGIFRLMLGQLHSYNRILVGLIRKEEAYTSRVKDLNFPVSWTNRKKVWWLPYVTHFSIFLILGLGFDLWLLGAVYYVGMLSHPVQGWMVNALAHKFGYRNFETPDNSKNNTLVAWFVMGEGFQNNHHKRPASAIFAARWWEIDLGYVMCHLIQAAHLIKINYSQSGFRGVT